MYEDFRIGRIQQTRTDLFRLRGVPCRTFEDVWNDSVAVDVMVRLLGQLVADEDEADDLEYALRELNHSQRGALERRDLEMATLMRTGAIEGATEAFSRRSFDETRRQADILRFFFEADRVAAMLDREIKGHLP